ncbi:MAG TPA: cytochrome c [Planctomycetota bacterium]|nr:cytochrome c [Planctomycetota bacterium]
MIANVAALLPFVAGCNERSRCCQAEAAPAVAASGNEAPSASAHARVEFDESTHTLELPQYDLSAAPGPHREVYQKQCSVCHTTRYVSMQPAFPEKKWNDEVTKMIKTFGAPITDADAKLILEYLVEVKGKK